MRQKYYVCMDYGLDETGKRVKKYKTYPTLAQEMCIRDRLCLVERSAAVALIEAVHAIVLS